MKDFTLEKIGGKIPANSQLDFNIYGDKVFALNVPAGCQIAFDNKAFVILKTGLRYGVNGWFSQTLREILMKINANLANALTPNTYNKISIRNNNETAVNVELLAGFGDINDDSVIITNVVKTAENWIIRDATDVRVANGQVQIFYSGYNVAIVENSGESTNSKNDIYIGSQDNMGYSRGVKISVGEKISFPFKDNFYLSSNGDNEFTYRLLIFKQDE